MEFIGCLLGVIRDYQRLLDFTSTRKEKVTNTLLETRKTEGTPQTQQENTSKRYTTIFSF